MASNLYLIPWRYHGVEYTIPFRISRRPSLFSMVLGLRTNRDVESTEDVTTEIRAVMGPNEDFNGVAMSPTLLGFDELIFFYGDDIVLEVKGTEIIRFDE